MKLKIRQAGLSVNPEIKQLPSKEIYLFYLKQQSVNFVVPIKINLPEILEASLTQAEFVKSSILGETNEGLSYSSLKYRETRLTDISISASKVLLKRLPDIPIDIVPNEIQ